MGITLNFVVVGIRAGELEVSSERAMCSTIAPPSSAHQDFHHGGRLNDMPNAQHSAKNDMGYRTSEHVVQVFKLNVNRGKRRII